MTPDEAFRRLQHEAPSLVNNEILLDLARRQVVNAYRALRREERARLADLTFLDRALNGLVEYHDKVEKAREEYEEQRARNQNRKGT